MIEEGQKAPAWTLLDQDGEKVKLADFKGRTVVLYFYPRADTPGCTTQACGIRDRRADYDAAGAVVDQTIAAEAARRNLDPADYLSRNDAYHFFTPLGALLKTGPTHTNVCDVRVVVTEGMGEPAQNG